MPRLQNPPLSLYVHLPWCVQKCPYCDFNSHPLRATLPEQDYLAALLSDLAEELARVPGRTIETVFFGGGTPSLFSAAAIGRVLEAVGAQLAADAEITLEANPGTVEHGAFSAYRAAGINRLSLGAQTFDAAALKRLGRIHGPDEIERAVDEARAAGLDNFNLDLMYALPAQSLDLALADIERALALGPAHLSHYQLTLEPQTPFAKHPPPLPDDDAIWTMQLECQAALAAAGFVQYETSAYARSGRQCRHNRNYWQYGDYLGVGAGAHGKLTEAASGRIVRREKVRHPTRYMRAAGSPAVFSEKRVADNDRMFEFMLNALRLNEGFDQRLVETRTGLPLGVADPALTQAMGLGLLVRDGERYAPSERGRAYLNDLQALFLPEAA
ncbi:MAG TPA: radical SAM family heme chaperone HemW [Gammaproteobacteria bacterium]|nr:radical SAM family heme chaperone HemW [Gammaproteobacteria bacterium]